MMARKMNQPKFERWIKRHKPPVNFWLKSSLELRSLLAWLGSNGTTRSVIYRYMWRPALVFSSTRGLMERPVHVRTMDRFSGFDGLGWSLRGHACKTLRRLFDREYHRGVPFLRVHSYLSPGWPIQHARFLIVRDSAWRRDLIVLQNWYWKQERGSWNPLALWVRQITIWNGP